MSGMWIGCALCGEQHACSGKVPLSPLRETSRSSVQTTASSAALGITATATIRATEKAMTSERTKHLLLIALLKGLAHAIRRDDLSASERYCQRLRLGAEASATDAPVKGVLAKLFVISGLWLRAAHIERNETRQQLLELIDSVLDLLTGGSISSARSQSREAKALLGELSP
jgi:hypothetical protein